LFARANEIIGGTRLPDELELKELDQYLKEDELSHKNQALTTEPIVGYWFKALRNSDIIGRHWLIAVSIGDQR
jgi:nucleosome assembly protein 1-like 1